MSGKMSYGNNPTEVLFGVFRDVADLCDLFATRNVAFFFDGGYDYRQKILFDYKVSRRKRRQEMDEEERELRRGLSNQIFRLRTKYLPEAKVKNVYWQEGIEADDLIASACLGLFAGESAVIVSLDEDMLQMLSPHVTVWNPRTKKSTTESSFARDRCIDPGQWAMVKAIAGCSSDDVPGVKGVGEKTAIKFLTGELKPGSKKYTDIQESRNLILRNIKLTRLPGPGTDPVVLKGQQINGDRWNTLMESLGMRSLVGRISHGQRR